MKMASIVSWAAGAALYVFVFAMVSAIVGRHDIVTVLFFGIALVLIARQWRRRQVTLRDADRAAIDRSRRR